MTGRLVVVPCELADANAFVAQHHRHSLPVVNHRFSIAATIGEQVVGVAIVGRPLSRALQDGWTVEALRVCTDGTSNACSFLYGRAWKAARALGWRRLVTYTLAEEGGGVPPRRGLPCCRQGSRARLGHAVAAARGQASAAAASPLGGVGVSRLLAVLAVASASCARPAPAVERITAAPLSSPTPEVRHEAVTAAPVVRVTPPRSVAPVAANSAGRGPSGGTCTASWYAAGLVAPEDLTAASRDHARGTRLRVTHGAHSVVVRVNDYGPQARTGRCIDLSRGAFRALANPKLGLIDVTVEAM